MPSPISNYKDLFHDFDPSQQYDQLIQQADTRMAHKNPSDQLGEIQGLTQMLFALRKTYWSRLPNGGNFGIITPHKSRIDHRIRVLGGTVTLLKPAADAYEENIRSQQYQKIYQQYLDNVAKNPEIRITPVPPQPPVYVFPKSPGNSKL